MNIELQNFLLACNFSERAKERGGSCLVMPQCSYGPGSGTSYVAIALKIIDLEKTIFFNQC